jgi:hypothetical protein
VIGNNKLVLNHATIIAALQMYLDAQRRPEAPPVKVVSVDERNGDFDVAVQTPDCSQGETAG